MLGGIPCFYKKSLMEKNMGPERTKNMKINFDEWNERRTPIVENGIPWIKNIRKKECCILVLRIWISSLQNRSLMLFRILFLTKGIFGYTDLSDRFYENIREWMRQKHQAEVSRRGDCILSPYQCFFQYLCGNIYRKKMNEVIINTPAYGPLYQAVVKNHRKVVESPLILENGSYKIDFAHLESVVTDKTKMFILCSPHNPVGRVWTKKNWKKLEHSAKKT